MYTFIFYRVTDDGIKLAFKDVYGNTHYIYLSDTELAAITTQAQLRAAVITKLRRKIQATNIASKLDPLIGQTITI